MPCFSSRGGLDLRSGARQDPPRCSGRPVPPADDITFRSDLSELSFPFPVQFGWHVNVLFVNLGLTAPPPLSSSLPPFSAFAVALGLVHKLLFPHRLPSPQLHSRFHRWFIAQLSPRWCGFPHYLSSRHYLILQFCTSWFWLAAMLLNSEL